MVGEEDGFDYGERMKGSELEGKRYIHPLAEEVPYQAELEEEQPKVHTILLSEKYVQETGGSGMVHTAPGHGPEDYEVGVENDIPIFSPVDEKGTYTEEAGQFKGKFVHNTNQEIVDILKEKDLLVHKEEIEHEYAHCWRCKSKLVYRATPQWFFKTSDLSEKMLEENEEIYWIPESAGKNSFASWLNNLRDWCISRQRFWGIPLSIWLCENEECDHRHVVGSVEELERLAGEAPKDLHKPWIDEVTFECNECGGTMKRTPDVLDVWLDSGSVMWASQKFVDGVEHYDTWEAADFILEGKDQIRGWFNSLLCSAMVSSGRRNYNACYMHGWVNSHGIKMSKSLGNTVDPEDVIEGKIEVLTEDEKEKLAEQAREDMSSKFDKTKDIKTRHKRKKQYLKDIKKWSNIKGIETFRFYSGLGTSAGQDLNLDHKDYVDTFRILKTLWNCYKFSQGKMKLNDFKPLEVELDEDKLKNADKWMLSQTNSMIKNVTELFDKYLLHEIPGKLQKFIVNDLSRWYIRLIRDRVDPSYDGEDKAQALATLWYVLYRLTLVMAPVNPMITERLYQKMFRAVDEENMKKSVHLESWPKVNEDFIDEKMEKQMRIARRIIDNVRSIKNDHKIKLRWPTKALYVMLPEEMDLVYNDLIKNSCNVKYFEYIDEPIEEGEHIITGKTEEKDIKIYLDIEDTEEIQYERIIRDLMRTMQYMRKVQKFQISDRVELRFGTEIPFLYKALNEFEEDLKDKMNAESVEVSDEPLEDEEGWVFYNFHVCLTEGCWAWVRGKKAKQIKGGNDRKKCGYCGESLKVDKLGIITVKFKKL